LIANDLEQAGLLDYLRAGVFLCGGGARIPQIPKLAEMVLQMPVTLGKANSISGLKSALDQPEFATAIGLVKFGSFQQRKRAGKPSLAEGIKSTFGQIFRRP
jgi:cell division protein FtsA